MQTCVAINKEYRSMTHFEEAVGTVVLTVVLVDLVCAIILVRILNRRFGGGK